VRNVMLELDEDGGGTLEVAEVTMPPNDYNSNALLL
jgi:hypothetical protein